MNDTPAQGFDYSAVQQLSCLSSAANAAGRSKGTTQDLQQALKTALEKCLPTLNGARWEVTWGPVVYKKDPDDESSGPMNAWYVAVDPLQKQCVIAIAGTALYSLSGWNQDFDVSSIVDFGLWASQWKASGIPKFTTTTYQDKDTRSLNSRGNCVFTSNILSNAPSSGFASEGILLAQYLQDFQNQNSDYEMYFVGHSMGGAVTPAVGLGLIQSRILKNDKVFVVPSAGASPGNNVFAEKFSSAFKPSGDYYNVDTFNSNDIVPQAWSQNDDDDRNLDNIALIYQSATPKMRVELEGVIFAAKVNADRSRMPYTPVAGKAFTGPAIPSGISTWDGLHTEISRQHITAYWEYMQIMGFIDLFWPTFSDQPGIGSPDDTESDYSNVKRVTY